jgi:predicted NUDIX family NTP pyrophosphohydrolase
VGDIVILEGEALRDFLEVLTSRDDVYRVRLAIDGGGVKVKRNEGTWTLPYGEMDS